MKRGSLGPKIAEYSHAQSFSMVHFKNFDPFLDTLISSSKFPNSSLRLGHNYLWFMV